MSAPSSLERERINHINCLMEFLHSSNAEIYEGLIDREFSSLPSIIDEQIERLQEIRNSVQDEL